MIAIVDDDVWFAEELQDFLILQGYGSVVVVPQPVGSSLTLLRAAQVLIIDVILGATTAVAVLEHLRENGGDPKVIIISGGGSEVVEGAVREASSRGFLVVGGMEKSVLATRLCHFVSQIYTPATTVRPTHRKLQEASAATGSVVLTSVVASSSLQHVGTRVRRGRMATTSATELTEFSGTSYTEAHSPETFVESSLLLQHKLELSGQAGLLFTPVPEDVVQDASYCRTISSCHGRKPASMSRIVLELDLSSGVDYRRLFGCVSELRLAGFGVLLRCSADELPPTAALAMIPMTALEILEPGKRDRRALSETMRMLRKQAIGSMCKVGRSLADLDQLRGLGFSLLDTGVEIHLLQGDQRRLAPSWTGTREH